MYFLEGSIVIISGCPIMTFSPASVRFSQVLPLTCLRQLWTIVYLVMFHGVAILKLFQLIPLIFHGKGKIFMPFLHLVSSHVSWKKWSVTKRKEMLITQPVVMVWKKETSLPIHPSGPRTQNMQGSLKLIACQLSRDTTKCRAFLNPLPTYLSTHVDLPLRNSIQFILRNGLYSLLQGKLLHFRQI